MFQFKQFAVDTLDYYIARHCKFTIKFLTNDINQKETCDIDSEKSIASYCIHAYNLFFKCSRK